MIRAVIVSIAFKLIIISETLPNESVGKLVLSIISVALLYEVFHYTDYAKK